MIDEPQPSFNNILTIDKMGKNSSDDLKARNLLQINQQYSEQPEWNRIIPFT